MPDRSPVPLHIPTVENLPSSPGGLEAPDKSWSEMEEPLPLLTMERTPLALCTLLDVRRGPELCGLEVTLVNQCV